MLSRHARRRDVGHRERASRGPTEPRDERRARACRAAGSGGPFRVVVPDELGEHRPEVLLVEDDQVIEASVPEGRSARSAIAFARGARAGLSRVWMPTRQVRRTTPPSETASQSRTKERGGRPYGVASMTCCEIHAAVGLAVTLRCTSSRSERRDGEQVHRPDLGAVVARKVRQIWLGGRAGVHAARTTESSDCSRR